MPVSRQSITASKPEHLRPYLHHGVQLYERGGHAIGDCPFCGKEGKFSVAVESGLWRCFVCGAGTENGGGNALVFIRLLHERSMAATQADFFDAVATDRRLASCETVVSWGICKSLLNGGVWLVPGYGINGRLDQLYRRVWMDESWRLLPTPGIWPEGKVHALHLPIVDFQESRCNIRICEGPWDGMALWEVGKNDDSNIIAAPGCNVWRDEWTKMCQGKNVVLMFDSDHPIERGGKTIRAGYDGMARVAKKLSGVAASVRWLRWGQEGYDPTKHTGWDVRDDLGGDNGTIASLALRRIRLTRLLAKIEDAPKEWFAPASHINGKPHKTMEALACSQWTECELAWMDALQWRQDMSDAMAVLLAVCASTNQPGNQLFLQLVGSAGSGKTTMCEGLLVSNHCHHLEHLTGFHSGWREAGDDKKDCSLIARINGKTLVTPEADVLMSSPRFVEIMSQQRRIFDGKSGATYKNTSEDKVYSGLRTPWIMAGTPALLDTDQSRLGDRFLRCIINDPGESEKRAILKSALRSERVAMLESINGTAGSLVDPKLRKAQALTGGYIDWLRANVEEQLGLVSISDSAEDYCIDLAELSADMRARPNEDRRKVEVHDSKELPTRLARQNIRLASCLAVVLNKKEVDKDILGIVRKVAIDTAHGHTLNIVKWLCSSNLRMENKTYHECGGLTIETLMMWSGMTNERLHKYLMFLRKINVLDWKHVNQSNGLWLLTDRVYELYLRIIRG